MPLLETPLPDILYRGKVRDTFDLRDGLLLMVATDRISAFDVVLPNGIPDKGRVLSRMSEFWFEITQHIVPNHFVALASDRDSLGALADHPKLRDLPEEIAQQAMVVKRAERIDAECVVRAYLTGSALVDYNATGTVFGVPMAPGLVEGSKLPGLMFTPTTKAEVGHDEPVSMEELGGMVGAELAGNLRDLSFAVFQHASRRRRRARHHHRRHQVRVRDAGRGHYPDRRGAHARFEPVLGRRFVQPRAVATQLR